MTFNDSDNQVPNTRTRRQQVRHASDVHEVCSSCSSNEYVSEYASSVDEKQSSSSEDDSSSDDDESTSSKEERSSDEDGDESCADDHFIYPESAYKLMFQCLEVMFSSCLLNALPSYGRNSRAVNGKSINLDLANHVVSFHRAQIFRDVV
jgi:hypothetical protein